MFGEKIRPEVKNSCDLYQHSCTNYSVYYTYMGMSQIPLTSVVSHLSNVTKKLNVYNMNKHY